jgi:hypothetical protein
MRNRYIVLQPRFQILSNGFLYSTDTGTEVNNSKIYTVNVDVVVLDKGLVPVIFSGDA